MTELHADKAAREAHERRIESMRRILGEQMVALFDDPLVVEIMANPDGTVFVERLGQGVENFGSIDPQRVRSFLGLMADYLGTTVSREKPIVEGAMPIEFIRSRFAGAIPPLVEGASFSIRLPARKIFTLEHYVENGIMTTEQHAKILQAVADRKNILVSGGTGCFSKGFPVRIFDGSIKPVESVKVGDLVMGPDKQPRRVVDLHHGIDEMYAVQPMSTAPIWHKFHVNKGHTFALLRKSDMRLVDVPLVSLLAKGAATDYMLYHQSEKVTDFYILPVRLGEYFGFELDGDHRFVDAYGVVHHNSGKTTLLNAVADVISNQSGPDQRIVVIEDTREIRCTAPNTVQFLTDPDSDIDMTRLLKLTLRYRPDRIFVGEVRDKAALALLKAWNTGHPGGLATLHANNPEAALIRLDQLCQEAGVPSQDALIREAVDVIIQIERDKTHPSGRRISDMLEIA